MLDVRELSRAVELAGLIAGVSQNVVKLSLNPTENGQPGTLLLSANAAGIGENTGTVDSEVSGEGGQIALNVKYLGEALTVIGTPQVAFEMVTAQAGAGRAASGRAEPWPEQRRRRLRPPDHADGAALAPRRPQPATSTSTNPGEAIPSPGFTASLRGQRCATRKRPCSTAALSCRPSRYRQPRAHAAAARPDHRPWPRALREALEPYVDLRKLRRLAAHGGNLQEALITGAVPEDVQAMITFVAELLRPVGRDQVKSLADAAAFLMARMGLLDQEEIWTMLLNTKNYVIKIHRVYQGNLNSSMVRIGAVFREALKLNAADLIVCHNHPSGSVDASPEDILVTRQIVEAGKLLDVEVLDHLILSKGVWLSMRERGLGFGTS